jgi:hypothetical protein
MTGLHLGAVHIPVILRSKATKNQLSGMREKREEQILSLVQSLP